MTIKLMLVPLEHTGGGRTLSSLTANVQAIAEIMSFKSVDRYISVHGPVWSRGYGMDVEV